LERQMNATATVAAQVCAALALSVAPTVGIALPPHRSGAVGDAGCEIALQSTELVGDLFRAPLFQSELSTEVPQPLVLPQSIRETTPIERAVGELRRWVELPDDWDGEGAARPIPNSLREAAAFTRLLPSARLVEPMLHADGRAGLYLRTGTLYADIEFLGDGRAAYYIESNGDKHKGVVSFDSKKMPPVFDALLET
jgi:hypothetical protein